MTTLKFKQKQKVNHPLFVLACMFITSSSFLVDAFVVRQNHILRRQQQDSVWVLSLSSSSSEAAAPTTKTSKTNSNSMQLLSGCHDLINDFDIFLLDMWGVMHDGSHPYDGVLDVVKELRQAGKQMVILSNSSKRIDHATKMLHKLGFDPTDFDQIITSGEVAYQMLSKAAGCNNNEDVAPMLEGEWYKEWDQISKAKNINNRQVFIFGSGDQDVEYCENAGWSIARTMEEASLIIARGTFTIVSSESTVEKKIDEDLYESELQARLQEAAKLEIPMLVCNPDKIRPDADRSPMPGRIGDAYEKVLRKAGVSNPDTLVKRIGKPFADVYDIALNGLSSNVDYSRVCMVGDALETDVAGGAKYNLATVWVLKDGVYKPDMETGDLKENAGRVLEAFNGMEGTYAKGQTLSPTYIVPHFNW